MNPYYNCIEIIGNLGKKPIVAYTNDSVAVTRIQIAVNEKYTDREGTVQENIYWFTALLYGELAERANQYLDKGDAVFVRGPLRMRSYEVNGEKRSVWEIHVDKMVMLSSSKEKP